MKAKKQISIVDHDHLQKVEAKRERRQAKRDKRDDFKRKEKEALLLTTQYEQQQAVQVLHSTIAPQSKDVHLFNFDIAYGKDFLMVNCDLTLSYGHKYGLVGRNGTGKSTLLKYIARRELIGIPQGLSILHVEQEVTGDDTTALQSVLGCDVERERLLEQEKALLAATATAAAAGGAGGAPQQQQDGEVSAQLKKIYERLQEIDAFTAESRASSILFGLGFTPEMQASATKSFSGGWRMRISLARALFCQPDILLLDEPTNHLDLYATLWLESYLQQWKGSVLIVSHLREFLNSVSTDIIHLHNKKLEHYKGNYDMYEQVRYERLLQQQRRFETQQAKTKHVQKFIDRFRYNANRAKLVQSRIKMLEKMEVIEEVQADPTLTIRFPDPEPLNPPILQFKDVSFGYSKDKILFRDLNLGIDLDSRVALVGANGQGKTTLLNVLAGELQPTDGFVQRHGKLRFARFSQHFVDQLKLDVSPIEHFLSVYPNIPQQTVRSHLGSFGLSGDIALRTINTLSGGQKSRLVFAVMAWRQPHVLLLDEPTNHLDIETIDALCKSLMEFAGGVLVVSHDERLISMVCDQLWYVHNGRVTPFAGEFKDYKNILLEELGLPKDNLAPH